MDSLNINKFARVLFLSLGIAGTCAAQRYQPASTPEESLKKINVAKGLKVQIYAAEPYVLDPVDLQFDDQGNAYVVEMPDYPFEVEPGKGKGEIRKLIDTDGDGRVDKSVVFADHITEGTSILPWKGGLIITAAPYILYLKDTNGDGKADVKQVLFSGFFQSNSEAQVTGLRFGVDNWIYANNRGQSGMITFSKKPGSPPVQVQGADFRFRLDRNQFELETGPGQFGQTIDDWGHRFFTENSIHVQQSIIPWRYTHRHSFLPISTFEVSITDHKELMFQKTVTPYWRAERSRRRNAVFKENGSKRVEYDRDHFTGAAGGVIYNGTALPKEFYGSYFVTDVAGSLVHRDVFTPSDKIPAFIASRPASETDSEFLTSTDTWFRPITTASGPDGYMYVVDYYRQHIETPVSIDDDLKADMDFMAGSDKGRIYRVLPEGDNYKAATINFTKMSSAKLVPYLANPNGWYITHAHRLLIERQDKTVIPVVKAFLAQTTDPRARLHALYVLEGLNALNAQIVKKALDDPEAGVRENALILAERYPELLPQILQKTDDPTYRVAFQAVLSAGNFASKQIIPTLTKVLEKYGQDVWFRTAVLSSNAGSGVDFTNALLKDNSFFQSEEPWKLAFVGDLSNVIGARNNKTQVAAYLTVLNNQKGAWLLSATKGLSTGLQRSATSSDDLKATLSSAKLDSDDACKQVIASLKKMY